MRLQPHANSKNSASRAGKQAKPPKPPRGNPWDVIKLASIYRRKHSFPPGYFFIAEDDDGRAYLTAMLRCGLSGERAVERAPWLEPAELKQLQADAAKLTFDQIGQKIGLTFEHWLSFKAWRFWPVERERAMAEKRRLRIEKDRDRKRAVRNRTLARPLAFQREQAVHKIIDRAGEITLTEIKRRMRRLSLFGPSPSCFGTSMQLLRAQRRKALDRIAERIVQKLKRYDLVRIKTRKGKYGPVLVVISRSVARSRSSRSGMQSGQKMSQLSCDKKCRSSGSPEAQPAQALKPVLDRRNPVRVASKLVERPRFITLLVSSGKVTVHREDDLSVDISANQPTTSAVARPPARSR